MDVNNIDSDIDALELRLLELKTKRRAEDLVMVRKLVIRHGFEERDVFGLAARTRAPAAEAGVCVEIDNYIASNPAITYREIQEVARVKGWKVSTASNRLGRFRATAKREGRKPLASPEPQPAPVDAISPVNL